MGSRTLDECAPHGVSEDIYVRSSAQVVKDLGSASDFELLHVNCEGCEYEVVQGLHQAGKLVDFAHIQLATHLIEPPQETWRLATTDEEIRRFSMEISAKRYCEAHRMLMDTHER